MATFAPTHRTLRSIYWFIVWPVMLEGITKSINLILRHCHSRCTDALPIHWQGFLSEYWNWRYYSACSSYYFVLLSLNFMSFSLEPLDTSWGPIGESIPPEAEGRTSWQLTQYIHLTNSKKPPTKKIKIKKSNSTQYENIDTYMRHASTMWVLPSKQAWPAQDELWFEEIYWEE